MFSAVTTVLTLLVAATAYVHAEPNPTSPGPGDIFIQGEPCTISWDVDTTGDWKIMNIDLMTGANLDMVFLTSVATGLDGTNPGKNTFSFTCPQVSPHSPIYFYQFTSSSTSNKTWTGRFTITDSPNDIVAPSQSTQPDGENIPWGAGSLAKGSAAASGAALAASGPGASVSNSRLPTSSASSKSTTPGSSVRPSNTRTQEVVHVTSHTPTMSSTLSNIGTNGAVATHSVLNLVFQTGLALALAALGLAVIL